MSNDFNQEDLVGIFLIEARDDLRALLQTVSPVDASLPTPEALHGQYLLAHRVKGAASQYGFTGIAEVGEILETSLEHIDDGAQDEWPSKVAVIRDLITKMMEQVDAIEQHEGPSDSPDVPPPQNGQEGGSVAGETEELDEASTSLPTLTDEYLFPSLDEEVLSYFGPEAQEYLDAIETSLLRLEKNPHDPETIYELFRTAHTLKGSAYTVGFHIIGDITHPVEDLMGAIRESRIQVTQQVMDPIFRAVDVIRSLMQLDVTRGAELRPKVVGLLQALRQAGGGDTDTAGNGTRSDGETELFPDEALATMLDPACSPETEEAEEGRVVEAAQPAPSGGWNTHKEFKQDKEGASKTAEESAVIRVSQDRLERLLNLVGELVIGRGRLDERLKTLEKLSTQVMAYRNRMLDTVRAFETKHAFTVPASIGQDREFNSSEIQALTDFGTLEFDTYDDFNILARRIAEVASDVSESMSQLNGSIKQAREDMGQLQHLTTGLRDEVARARMVPIGTPFLRFRRAVREMAKVTGKEVALVTAGEHTEVDTMVVERLVDPLTHLVRNAVAHGIETAEVRTARGKTPMGTVYVSAAHRGNSVLLEVEDDGGGLNIEKIRAQAVSMGLLTPDTASSLPQSELTNLIFLPAFSTADSVGGQAGRGMGMDVVKRTIEGMGGQIIVETLQGVGTKFTLQLPLTLLISTALLFRVGAQRYALPLPSVREVILPAPGDIQSVDGRAIIRVLDETISVEYLRTFLHQEPQRQEESLPVIIVRTPIGPLGLVVDELLGRQEIVIKGLGTLKPLQKSYFGGATIDPEGRVVLVLDANRLVSPPENVSIATKTTGSMPRLSGPSEGEGAGVLAKGGRQASILLIDDSLSIRKFVGRMLEGGGFAVETAVDGEEGLRKAANGSFHLIITDLEMPKANGYEVIQALRNRPSTHSTPVVVMTTRAGEKHRQVALGMGANGYITKPVEERALIDEVSKLMGLGVASNR